MEQRSDPNELSLSQASDLLDWERAPQFGRRATLVQALRRLHELHAGQASIVETGTLRDDRPQACNSDGWSTLALGWYAAQTGGQVFTVDVNSEAIETFKRLTAGYAANLRYACADSLAFLREWPIAERGEIHLLYLDSLDYFDRDARELHHRSEAETTPPACTPCCRMLFYDRHTRPDTHMQRHSKMSEGKNRSEKV